LHYGTAVRDAQIYKRKEADGMQDQWNPLSEAIDIAGITECVEHCCCVVEDLYMAHESWTGVSEWKQGVWKRLPTNTEFQTRQK
jgi:hypothetical protein